MKILRDILSNLPVAQFVLEVNGERLPSRGQYITDANGVPQNTYISAEIEVFELDGDNPPMEFYLSQEVKVENNKIFAICGEGMEVVIHVFTPAML